MLLCKEEVIVCFARVGPPGPDRMNPPAGLEKSVEPVRISVVSPESPRGPTRRGRGPLASNEGAPETVEERSKTCDGRSWLSIPSPVFDLVSIGGLQQ